MPRPKKCRRVCGLPGVKEFGPRGMGCGGETVLMGLDEYEAIRLIDLMGLQQEQAAGQMGVARTTAQAIYNLSLIHIFHKIREHVSRILYKPTSSVPKRRAQKPEYSIEMGLCFDRQTVKK